MNIESFQDTLFEDPIGLRFRHAREKARWSQESAAQQLKLPVAVLDAIEREDWARLGAPIFVRSYVGSYARLLGLPATLADEVVRGKPAPQLVSIGGTALAKRPYNRRAVNLGYILMTVLIVAAVVALALYYQSPLRSAAVLPLDIPAGQNDPAPQTAVPENTNQLVSYQVPSTSLGSPAPADSALPKASQLPSISLHFRGDSWVDLVDPSGAHLERGVLPAGTERSFEAGQLASVTLGDASAVDVRLAGNPLDLAPFSDAKVARFTVSSDGTIAGN